MNPIRNTRISFSKASAPKATRKLTFRVCLNAHPLYLVKELLGHTNVATTEIYLKFPIDYLKQVFEQKDNLEKTPELLDQVPIKRTPQQIHTVPAEASA